MSSNGLERLYTLREVAELVGHTLHTIRTRLWRHRDLFEVHRYKRNGKRPNQVRVLTEQEVERLMGLMVRTRVYAPDVSRPPLKSLKRERELRLSCGEGATPTPPSQRDPDASKVR